MTYYSVFLYCRQSEERVQSQQNGTKPRNCGSCGKTIVARPKERSTTSNRENASRLEDTVGQSIKNIVSETKPGAETQNNNGALVEDGTESANELSTLDRRRLYDMQRRGIEPKLKVKTAELSQIKKNTHVTNDIPFPKRLNASVTKIPVANVPVSRKPTQTPYATTENSSESSRTERLTGNQHASTANREVIDEPIVVEHLELLESSYPDSNFEPSGSLKSQGNQQATPTTKYQVKNEPLRVEQVELLESTWPGNTLRYKSKANGKNVPQQVTKVRRESYDDTGTDSDGETQFKSMYMATFKKRRPPKREPGERATWKTAKGLWDFHHEDTMDRWMTTYEMMQASAQSENQRNESNLQ